MTFRTGVQLVHHEKQMIINAAGFGGKFEWIIISVQPQVSTERRNLYTTYGNEQTNHLIKKLKY